MMEALTLIKCGLQPTQARLFAPVMDLVFDRFKIILPDHKAAVIAEARHESLNFTHLEESTYYSRPQVMRNAYKRLRAVPDSVLLPLCRNGEAFGNYVYANVNGNGNEASGDGFRYRGRGLPQLTGRTNYAAFARDTGGDYLDNPKLLLEPLHAALAFGWFWQVNNLASVYARGGIDAVSVKINGGINGLDERREMFEQCQDVFS